MSRVNRKNNHQNEKKECKYGEECYQTNLEHINKYSHPYRKKKKNY